MGGGVQTMSKIDRRIVEMRFDNDQFEKGVSVTMRTLETLKDNLDFGKDVKKMSGLSDISKNLDLSGVATGVDNIASRISTMGIIGKTVIEEMTKGALNFAKKTFDMSIGQIISGGKSRALNLEQAEFMFKGLGVDHEKALESSGKSVLGTMYGMDEAAKLGSQFAASGVDVGDAMFYALRGVAGVSAMTGSEFPEIGRIFATIAGNGRLMGDQLNQFGARGLNVAAIIAKEMGISEEAVRKLVSQGKISFEDFSQSMYEAFGEHATNASGLFSGAVAHAKAALARIGGDFAPSLFDGMRDVLLELRHFIDKIRDILEPFIPGFEALMARVSKAGVKMLESFDASPITGVVNSVVNVFKALWSITKPIGQAFKDIFPKVAIDTAVQFTDAIAEFTSKMILSEFSSKALREVFKGLFSVASLLVDVFVAIWHALEPVRKALGALATLGLKLISWVAQAVTGFIKFVKWTQIIEYALKPLTWALNLIVDSFIWLGKQVYLTFASFKDSALYSGITKLIDIFKRFGNATKDVMVKASGNIKKHLGTMKDSTITNMNKIRDKFNDSKLKTAITRVTDNIVDFGKKTIKATAEAASGTKGKLKVIGSSFAGMFKDIDFSPLTTKFSALSKFIKDWAGKAKVAMEPYVRWMGEQLVTLTGKFMDHIRALESSDFAKFFGKVVEKAKDLTKALFDSTEGLRNFGKRTFEALKESENLVGFLKSLWEILKDVGTEFKVYAERLKETVTQSQAFQEIIKPMWEALQRGADTAKESIGEVIEKTGELAREAPNNISTFVSNFISNIKPLQKIKIFGKFLLDPTKDIVESMKNFSYNAITAVGKGLDNIWNKLSDILDSSSLKNLLNVMLTGAVTLVLLEFKRLMSGFRKISDSVSGSITAFGGVFTSISKVLKDLQKKVKADALKSIAIALAILVGSIVALSLIEPKKLKGAMQAMTELFLQLAIFLAVLDKVSVSGSPKKIMGIAVLIFSLAVSVSILARAIRKIDEDTKGMDGISGGLLTTIVLFAGIITSINNIKVPAINLMTLAAMLVFVESVRQLSKVVRKLAKLDSADLMKGLAGVVILIIAATNAFKDLDKMENIGFGSAAMVLAFAGAITILASAVKKLGGLDLAELSKGLVGVLTIMTGLALALNVMADTDMEPGKMLGMAGMILAVAGAVTMLSLAVEKFGEMDTSSLIKGLIAVTALIAGLTIAMNLMPTDLTGGLAILGIALALRVLVPVLERLSDIPFDKLLKGIGGLVLVFAALGVVGLLLAPVAPVLLTLGLAVAAFGLAVGLVLGGIGLFIAALIKFSGLSAVEMAAIITAFGLFVAAIPEIFAQFVEALADASPRIKDAFIIIAQETLDGLRTILPDFMLFLQELFDAMMTFLETNTPRFFEVLGVFVNELFDFLEEVAVPRTIQLVQAIIVGLITAGGELIGQLWTWIKGQWEKYTTWYDGKVEEAKEQVRTMVSNMVSTVKEKAGDFVEAMKSLPSKGLAKIKEWWGKFKTWASDTVDKMKTGISERASSFVDGVKELPTKALAKIEEWWAKFKLWAITLVANIVKGIFERGDDVGDSVTDIMDSAFAVAEKVADGFKAIGGFIVGGIRAGIEGAKSIGGAIKGVIDRGVAAAKKHAGIESPAKMFIPLGRFMSEGIAVGVTRFAGSVSGAMVSTVDKAKQTVIDVLGDISSLIDDDPDFNPTIRPVVDLDDARRALDSLFDDDPIIDTSTNASQIRAVDMSTNDISKDVPTTTDTTTEGDTVIENHYEVHATIREESDIRKVSEDLYRLQRRELRGKGIPT